MRDMEHIYIDLENQAEDIERVREAALIFSMEGFADTLASIAKDIRRDVAALRAAKPSRRPKHPKLVVNNSKH